MTLLLLETFSSHDIGTDFTIVHFVIIEPVLLGFVYHVHCTKFCEVLLSLDIFSSKYWYRTLSARDH